MRNLTVVVLFFGLIIAGCQTISPPEAVHPSANSDPVTISGHKYFQDAYVDSAVCAELLYVPIYSDVFYLDEKRTLLLAATLSIHNVDLDHPITLTAVDYYDHKGRFLRTFLEKPRTIQPLETVNFVVEEQDRSGGPGANFLVEWVSDNTVQSPIVEALMITGRSNYGISFMTSGKVLKSHGCMTTTAP